MRRRQIVQATLEIVGEKGLSGLTTAEIGRRVGVAEATVFKHFAGKAEILREVTRTFHARLQDLVQEITRRPSPAPHKLENLLRCHLEALRQNPGIPRMIFAENLHLHDAVIRENIRRALAGVRQVVGSIVTQGMQEGAFRRDIDPEMAATCYIGLVQTTIFRWVLNGGGAPLDEEAHRAADFLVRCLGREQLKTI